MTMFKTPGVNTTVYFQFTTNASTGAAVAPSSAFEAADILIYKNGSATQRSSTNGVTMTSPFDSITGLHQVAIDLSDNTDAGFYAVGADYSVVLSPDETVDSVAVVAVIGGFRIVAAESSAGVPKVDVTHFGGTAGTFASGRPEANMTHIAGSAVSTSTAQIGVNAVQAGGVAWGSGAITAASIADGAIDRATFAADTGMQSIRSNTAQAGASTTITLDASASATTDYYKGCLIYLTGGTGAGQARFCTAYNGTTKVATVGSAWATNPSSGTTFAVLPLDLTTITAAITAVETDTQDIQSRLPAALVSGRIDASVGAMASGVVTAAAVATGAIDADALAADAVAEIADGVWDEAISGHLTGGSTGAALNAAGSAGDPWSTPLPGAYSSGTAGKIIGDNLNATMSSRASQTSLDTVDDFLDTEIAAIKAKTDNLPASPAATGDIPTASAIADAVWDELLSGHTTSGSAGKSLADTEVDAAAVEVDTQDIQSRLPAALVSGRIDASVGAMASNVMTAAAANADLASEIAAAVMSAAASAPIAADVKQIKTVAVTGTGPFGI